MSYQRYDTTSLIRQVMEPGVKYSLKEIHAKMQELGFGGRDKIVRDTLRKMPEVRESEPAERAFGAFPTYMLSYGLNVQPAGVIPRSRCRSAMEWFVVTAGVQTGVAMAE